MTRKVRAGGSGRRREGTLRVALTLLRGPVALARVADVAGMSERTVQRTAHAMRDVGFKVTSRGGEILARVPREKGRGCRSS